MPNVSYTQPLGNIMKTTNRQTMNKNEILKNLNEIQFDLMSVKEKLDKVLSQPIWDNKVANELDDTIIIFQDINKHINDLVEIQKRIIFVR